MKCICIHTVTWNFFSVFESTCRWLLFYWQETIKHRAHDSIRLNYFLIITHFRRVNDFWSNCSADFFHFLNPRCDTTRQSKTAAQHSWYYIVSFAVLRYLSGTKISRRLLGPRQCLRNPSELCTSWHGKEVEHKGFLGKRTGSVTNGWGRVKDGRGGGWGLDRKFKSVICMQRK